MISFQIPEQFDEKVHLHHGFSSCHCHAAVAVEGEIGIKPLQDLMDAHEGSLPVLPGVRVVTVPAPHGTALEKYDIAYAGAVHRAAALDRVDISFTFPRGRYVR